jgi:hypothetical protein
LEVAHRLVSIVFYGMVTAAGVQFTLRLIVDPGKLNGTLLNGAVACTGVAAMCFFIMLVLGLLGKFQSS